MFRRFTAVIAALALGAGFALADDGHDHAGHDHAAAHDHSAKHGGVVTHSGHHHLEPGQRRHIELYVSGEEGAEALDGAKATATVLCRRQDGIGYTRARRKRRAQRLRQLQCRQGHDRRGFVDNARS